ncbi:transcriptional regulator, TetR family [Rathayibacter oskolensis]|uniref:Transcriptional regulator, TetR family n=1 Tax=Rathayibacter oskolensis TaxID=1891671 RepID=A0A1X7PJ11_9MICO|nr:TetR family transcriptional regulator [Rathayibacter oskolensis]SMH50905.1 transcriptional regulator, TetR family [Rathayibacter oskolensis]
MITTPTRRTQLLERIVDHILENGVATVTLRSLARAADSNNRMLLYYFGSRAALLSEAMVVASQRFPDMQRAADELRVPGRSLGERLDRSWEALASAANRPYLRLFFQVFGLAAFEQAEEWRAMRASFDEFLQPELRRALAESGVPDDEVPVAAREIVALWRGLEILLISIEDDAGVDVVRRRGHADLLARLES